MQRGEKSWRIPRTWEWKKEAKRDLKTGPRMLKAGNAQSLPNRQHWGDNNQQHMAASKKKKKKADHLWHATYGKRSLYIGKILVRDKKRKRALGFERKTIRSSRTAQEVLEEESISSSKSVSVKAQREKGPWLPIHKWLMDGTGGLLSQIWARHWKGYRCVQRSIHSLQSFHSRAAEGKLTHTIPLTLNTVPITWEQKFKEERNQKERLKEESSQAKTWEVVRILIVCWEQKKEHRGVEKKHDLCSARQKGHIG